jgi:probable HAF family extracellular repeat protein
MRHLQMITVNLFDRAVNFEMLFGDRGIIMERNSRNLSWLKFHILLVPLLIALSFSYAQAGSISGKVIGSQDAPLPNIYVQAVNINDPYSYISVFTESDGKYSITGLESGIYKVYFDADTTSDYLSEWYNNKNDIDSADLITVTASETVTLNARLTLGATIKGKITDASGNGLDASVYVNDSFGGPVGDNSGANSDMWGNYTIKRLPAGRYKISFQHIQSLYAEKWYNNRGNVASADLFDVATGNIYTLNAVLDSCPYTIYPASINAKPASSSGFIAIATTGSNCSQWSASSNADWITLTGITAGTGSERVDYHIAQNTSGSERTGTISIAGQLFSVTQWPQSGSGAELLQIGLLPQTTKSAALAVSADGNTVVGMSSFYSVKLEDWIHQAFRWTRTKGLTSLGLLNTEYYSSVASAVSADGSVITGWVVNDNWNYRIFRWTKQSGMQDLGVLTGGSHCQESGISADGSVIVGTCSVNGYKRPFRWTQATGIVDLGQPDENSHARAYGVSSDGSIIVGSAYYDAYEFHWQAVYWSPTLDMIRLGYNNEDSASYAVTSDGNYIVGGASWTPFRKSLSSDMIAMGSLGGGNAAAYGVSADGRVVVGGAYDNTGNSRAFLWTPETGIGTLDVWLGIQGLDTSATSFLTANAISADGNVIVGELTNGHAFVAHLVAKNLCADHLVLIYGTTYYFPSIQSAYDAASSNQKIMMQSAEFTEDIVSDSDINIRFSGGYNCTFLTKPGVTTLNGSLTVKAGRVTLENIIIK